MWPQHMRCLPMRPVAALTAVMDDPSFVRDSLGLKIRCTTCAELKGGAFVKTLVCGLAMLGASANVFALCGANFPSCPQDCSVSSCIEHQVALPPKSTRTVCVTAPANVNVEDVGWGLYLNPNNMGGSWWQYRNFVNDVNGNSQRNFCITGDNQSDYDRGT
jgi:hypothetical protein